MRLSYEIQGRIQDLEKCNRLWRITHVKNSRSLKHLIPNVLFVRYFQVLEFCSAFSSPNATPPPLLVNTMIMICSLTD